MKRCPTCKEEKDDRDFYFFKGKPHGHCKKCHRIHSRKSSLKREYGLTLEAYDDLLKGQGYVCAICKQPGHTNNRQKYPLYVDHNHETNEVRALLCSMCNTLVGWLENNPQLVAQCEQYISDH